MNVKIKLILMEIIVLILFSFSLIFSFDKQYVLLVSFDGFRWDYLNRGITPNLEKIRNEGVYALSLRPAFPTKTFPNHYTLVTGMFPENHGIISNSILNPFSNERYRIGDTVAVRNHIWYKGEAIWETANRNGIKSASFFWVGSEQNLPIKQPTYFYHYDHNLPYIKRIEGVIEWLKLPDDKRPQLITLYFDEPDSKAHRFGTNSKETNEAIAMVDSMVGILIYKLNEIGWDNKINLILVSDHGMTDIDEERRINIEEILKDYKCKFDGTGPVMMIDVERNKVEEVYQVLKKNEKNYRVYKKENIPSYYNFSKYPFIFPIIVIADVGWSLVDNNFLSRSTSYSLKANHGYEKDHLDMHGIFIAKGPAFRKGYKTGTLWNIDVYPLICKILSIEPNHLIDGDLNRIEFILK